MEVVLVMFRADGQRRSFPLTHSVTVIGRREDCDLRIPLTEVSRKHCRVIRSEDSIRLEDLGSSNGTYHNGARIQETAVQPGDQVQIGPVIFTVQVDGFPPDDAIEPPKPVETEAAADNSGDHGAQTIAVPQEGDSSIGLEAIPSAARAQRPSTPEEDDFALSPAPDAKDDDDDIVDMGDLSSNK
jgi:predicted component of type VI protein secretion system